MQRPLPIVRENGGQADQTVRFGSFGLSRNDRNYQNWWLDPTSVTPSDLRESLCGFLDSVLPSTRCSIFITLVRQISVTDFIEVCRS